MANHETHHSTTGSKGARFLSRHDGFSLIEAIITIGILGLVTLGFAQFMAQAHKEMDQTRVGLGRDAIKRQMDRYIVDSGAVLKSTVFAGAGSFPTNVGSQLDLCVHGAPACAADGTNCCTAKSGGSAVQHPFTFVDSTGLPIAGPSTTNPVYYDSAGDACTGPVSSACPFVSHASFSADCGGADYCANPSSIRVTYSVEHAGPAPMFTLKPLTGAFTFTLPVVANSTGVPNYLAKWVTSTQLGTSRIFEDPIAETLGIGTTTPAAKFQVGAAPNATGAMSPTLATYAGGLGTTAGNDLPVASFGFGSSNTTALGIHGYRVSNGTDWTTTAIGIGMDVDNTTRVNGSGLWFNANGNVGIGNTNPANRLHVQHGPSSMIFGDEAGAAVLRLKTTTPGQVSVVSVGNGVQSWQMRAGASGEYTWASEAPAYVERLSIKGITTSIPLLTFADGTTFSVPVHSTEIKMPTARILSGAGVNTFEGWGGPTVFKGSGASTTYFGNWDGGNTMVYSANTGEMLAKGIRLSASGAAEGIELNTQNTRVVGNLNVGYWFNAGAGVQVAGNLVCTAGGCTSSSDRRLKTRITPLTDSLDKVLRLEGVSYDWRDKSKFGSGRQIGLIAQDVEKIFPEVVRDDPKSGFKSIAYDHLVGPIVESIKALNGKVRVLVERVTELVRKVAFLDERVEKLERNLASAESEKTDLQSENSELKAQLTQMRESQLRLEKRLERLESAPRGY